MRLSHLSSRAAALSLTILVVAGCSGGEASSGAAVANSKASSAAGANEAPDMPLWAYGVTTVPLPGDKAKPQPPPGPHSSPESDRNAQLAPMRIAGSERSYTRMELSDWQHVADWFPDQHGPVPRAIEHGPESLGAQTRACGFCHRVEGGGRPENAPVFGLPVAYFLRQIDDFRNDRRRSSDPRKPNTPTMIALAKAIGDDEVRAVAEFWSQQSGGPHVRVIETDRAPSATLHGNLFVATSDNRNEPLTERILEVPEDLERSGVYDDPRSGFIAYVPEGSIARGRRLATTSEVADAVPAAAACVTCHGADLRGLGDAPPLAGRSPSYLARQLHDFRTGARNGTMAVLMQPVAARLTPAQITDLTAYIASLPRRDGEQ